MWLFELHNRCWRETDFLFVLSLATFSMASPVLAAAPLPLCYENVDIRPWLTADGRGLNFELLRRVERETGVKFRISPLPWKRCLLQLKNNEVAGAIGASFKLDRLEMGAYPGASTASQTPDVTKRLNVDRYVLVRRKGSMVSWDGKSITGLEGAVGAQLGYSIIDLLKTLNVKVDDGSHGASETLRKLLENRLSAAALLAGEAESLLSGDPKFAAGLEIVSPPLVEKAYFLMLSHDLLRTRPELAARIWNAIEKVRNSADYQRLEIEAFSKGSK